MVLEDMKFDCEKKEERNEQEIHEFYKNLLEGKGDLIKSESEPESDQE